MDAIFDAEIDALFARSRETERPHTTMEMLEFIAKFRHMSPFNAALVYFQKPGSVLVASAEDWEMRFHRTVCPHAQPIVILHPFAPVRFVYDLSDTEGEPIPEGVLLPPPSGTVTEIDLQMLTSHLSRVGICYQERPFGAALHGELCFQPYETCLVVAPKSPAGRSVCVRAHYTIAVNASFSISERFAAILHELAHFFCGHLNPLKLPFLPMREELSAMQTEFEAEGIAYVVCQRMGLKPSSEAYLHDYQAGQPEPPQVGREVMLQAMRQMEQLMRGELPIPKALIVQ